MFVLEKLNHHNTDIVIQVWASGGSSVSSRRLRGEIPPPPQKKKISNPPPQKKTQQTTMLCSGVNGAINCPLPLNLKSPPKVKGSGWNTGGKHRNFPQDLSLNCTLLSWALNVLRVRPMTMHVYGLVAACFVYELFNIQFVYELFNSSQRQ